MDATVRPSHGQLSGHRSTVRLSVRYRPRDNPDFGAPQTFASVHFFSSGNLDLFASDFGCLGCAGGAMGDLGYGRS
jgi:hypothetical protein